MSAPLTLTMETPEVLRFDELTAAARARLQVSDAWQVAGWERLSDDETLVELGVPHAGHRFDPKAWKGVDIRKCVVRRADVQAARDAYERTTGRCVRCCGRTEEWNGWSRDAGHRFKPCTRCNATGIAPNAEVAT